MRSSGLRFTLLAVLTVCALAVSAKAQSTFDATYLGKIEQKIMAAWKLPPNSDGLKVVLRYNPGAERISVVRARREKFW